MGRFPEPEFLVLSDLLIEFPEVAAEYAELKRRLADQYPGDRAGYTQGKTEFVRAATDRAKLHYREGTIPGGGKLSDS